MYKKIAILFAVLAFLSLALGNGTAPGNCDSQGNYITSPYDDGTDGGYISYCKGGYGRPTGTCNCIRELNSCLQYLAGCPSTFSAEFVPALPAVLYVGTFYNFTININATLPTDLCHLRPLPAGLSWAWDTSSADTPIQFYSIVGTPTESMPKADYGVAAYRGNAWGGFSKFFSFEIQSCSTADAVYPDPSSTCTEAQQGHMRCAGGSFYQTCTNGQWLSQACNSGLKCTPSAPYIYCL